ncbi:MAG: menaquinone biosynthesis decarboxylase [Nitrospinae bacterium]|nr:menaquinone biosynthesis decarboxylase [Nitrospinota bacterium]
MAHLEQMGELVRISEKVSPELEITEITDRVSKMPGGGKALLFENVEGSSMPVLINAFGSRKRMAASLGVDDVEKIAAGLDWLIKMKAPETWQEKLAMLPTLFKMARFTPKTVNDANAPCQEVVLLEGDVDLTAIPVLKCWPDDGGRFITLPCVFTKSVDGRRNVGMYRMQVYNARATGMHWHIHKDGARFFDQHRARGERMEVAVALGCDPAVIFSATAPMPPGVDELLLAGFIRGKGVELVKCRTVDLEVPRTAEIVIEGYVNPDETRLEGPFGDHTGYYSLTGMYPVFHVTAITHRKNPIYPTTIVGKPPMEDCYMGKATERIFLPLLKTLHPEIVDYDLPWEGVFHNCVIVSVKKRYPANAKQLMSSLWGAGQMSFAKMIMTMDAGVNVHDYAEVAHVLLNRLNMEEDITISEGVLDVLDHSAPKALYGAKLGIDVTSPVEGESRKAPEYWGGRPLEPFINALRQRADVISWAIPYEDVANPLAIIAVDKRAPFDGRRIPSEALKADTARSIKIVIALDKEIDPANYSVALWKFFNNVDPRRDMVFEDGRMIIDATKKLVEEGHPREWPDDLEMIPAVKTRVNEMWPRLGL